MQHRSEFRRVVARKRIECLRALRFGIGRRIGPADDPKYVWRTPPPTEDTEVFARGCRRRLERALPELCFESTRHALRARSVVDRERVAAERRELRRFLRAG